MRTRNFAGGGDDGETVRGCFEGESCVFEIDCEPIEVAAGHQTGGGCAGEREPCADTRLSVFEF